MSAIKIKKEIGNNKSVFKILVNEYDSASFWAYKDEVLFQINEEGPIIRLTPTQFRKLSKFIEEEIQNDHKRAGSR